MKQRQFIQVVLQLVFSIFMCGFMYVSAWEEEISVKLNTNNPYAPLYITPIYAKQSGLSESYINKLEEVLSFDFQHNGLTYVLQPSSEKNKQALLEGFDTYQFKQWESHNVAYILKVKVLHQELSISLYSVQDEKCIQIKNLSLTGNLPVDRIILHQVSDACSKKLFGESGHASSRILYSISSQGDTGDKIAEIWQCDYDGKNNSQITNEKKFAINPVYIPPNPGFKSGGFVYVSYRNRQPRLYMASLVDGIGRRLSTLRGNQLMPHINYSRDKLVFISDVSGNPDVYLYHFNPNVGVIGKPRQIYASERGAQGSPIMSPDGNHIAFVSNQSGSARIYIMETPLKGQIQTHSPQATLVTKNNRENTSPAWSPDGKKIAYIAKVKGVRQVWLYDFMTRKEQQLSDGNWNKENPSWSPDSKYLVFNSSRNNDSDLFILDVISTKVTRITQGKGQKRFPHWEPLVEK